MFAPPWTPAGQGVALRRTPALRAQFSTFPATFVLHTRACQNEKKDIETGESETKSEEQKFNEKRKARTDVSLRSDAVHEHARLLAPMCV